MDEIKAPSTLIQINLKTHLFSPVWPTVHTKTAFSVTENVFVFEFIWISVQGAKIKLKSLMLPQMSQITLRLFIYLFFVRPKTFLSHLLLWLLLNSIKEVIYRILNVVVIKSFKVARGYFWERRCSFLNRVFGM